MTVSPVPPIPPPGPPERGDLPTPDPDDVWVPPPPQARPRRRVPLFDRLKISREKLAYLTSRADGGVEATNAARLAGWIDHYFPPAPGP